MLFILPKTVPLSCPKRQHSTNTNTHISTNVASEKMAISSFLQTTLYISDEAHFVHLVIPMRASIGR